jgi:hypothetical protein
MRTGKVEDELKPDEKLRKRLKARDDKVMNKLKLKSPSETKSEKMRKKFAARGKPK